MVDIEVHIDPKEIEKFLDKEMDKLADQILTKSQENIVSNGSVDEGLLLKFGKVIRRFLEKEIVYDAPYSVPVEFGRLPGVMPPVDPIAEWVKRKLGEREEKKAKGIAWAIAKDMKEHGLQPKPFLQPAIDFYS